MKTTRGSERVFQRVGLHGDVGVAAAGIGGGSGGGGRHAGRHADRAAADGDAVVTVVAMAVMMGIEELALDIPVSPIGSRTSIM
jgi:hypothetical protein